MAEGSFWGWFKLSMIVAFFFGCFIVWKLFVKWLDKKGITKYL